jgi:hypothetical protein
VNILTRKLIYIFNTVDLITYKKYLIRGVLITKNDATESAPKSGATSGKEKASAPEKSLKKEVKTDSKSSKGAKK